MESLNSSGPLVKELDISDKLYQIQNFASVHNPELCIEIMQTLFKSCQTIYKNSIAPKRMQVLIDSITNPHLNELRSMTSPPVYITLCAEALLLFLNVPLKPIVYVSLYFKNYSFWEGNYQDFKLIIKKYTFKEELKKRCREDFNEEMLELFEPFINAEWFTQKQIGKASSVCAKFTKLIRQKWTYHKEKIKIKKVIQLQNWLKQQEDIQAIYEKRLEQKYGKQLENIRKRTKQCVICQNQKTFEESGGFILAKCGHFFHRYCFYCDNEGNVICPFDQISINEEKIIPYPGNIKETILYEF